MAYNDVEASAEESEAYILTAEHQVRAGKITVSEALHAVYLRGVMDVTNIVADTFDRPQVDVEDLFAGKTDVVRLNEAVAESVVAKPRKSVAR